MRLHLVVAVTAALSACGVVDSSSQSTNTEQSTIMDLGNFSVSLAVKDLATSRAFYEKLGFSQVGGEPEHNWIILQNGTTNIGLFQGMFEQNILTFNPGWTHEQKEIAEFTDVREIQRRLEASGIEIQRRADESTTGPASVVIVDPDGNPVLIDQHR